MPNHNVTCAYGIHQGGLLHCIAVPDAALSLLVAAHGVDIAALDKEHRMRRREASVEHLIGQLQLFLEEDIVEIELEEGSQDALRHTNAVIRPGRLKPSLL